VVDLVVVDLWLISGIYVRSVCLFFMFCFVFQVSTTDFFLINFFNLSYWFSCFHEIKFTSHYISFDII
jgi:hypothetical protein